MTEKEMQEDIMKNLYYAQQRVKQVNDGTRIVEDSLGFIVISLIEAQTVINNARALYSGSFYAKLYEDIHVILENIISNVRHLEIVDTQIQKCVDKLDIKMA